MSEGNGTEDLGDQLRSIKKPNKGKKAPKGVIKWWKQLSKSHKALTMGLAVGLVGVGIFGKIYMDMNTTLGAMQQEVVVQEVRKEEVDIGECEPVSILLIGVDNGAFGRGVDAGRADTIMVLTINPDTKETQLLSIPRDTYVTLHDSGEKDKINHSYAYGGVENTINTVQDYLDIPIDYYISVNMSGLVGVIDAIGGIEVTSDFAFDFWDSGQSFSFKEGEIHLTGDEALGFARMRKEDPEGDTGRQKRQQKVIEGVMKKALSLDSIANYGDILATLSDNVKTNLTMQELIKLQRGYLPAFESLNKIVISDYVPTYIDEIYYSVVPDAELLAISSTLRNSLGLTEEDFASIVGESSSLTSGSSSLSKLAESSAAVESSISRAVVEKTYEDTLRESIASSIASETTASSIKYQQESIAEATKTAQLKASLEAESIKKANAESTSIKLANEQIVAESIRLANEKAKAEAEANSILEAQKASDALKESLYSESISSSVVESSSESSIN